MAAVGVLTTGLLGMACTSMPVGSGSPPADGAGRGVTLGEVRTAAQRAVACMLDAGVQARYAEDTRDDGRVLPGWRAWIAPQDGDDPAAVVEACDRAQFRQVSRAYQSQEGAERVTVHAGDASTIERRGREGSRACPSGRT